MRIFNGVVILLSITGAIITILYSNFTPSEYRLIWILPVLYVFLYTTIYQPVLRNANIRITSVSLVVLMFLKTVINPVFITLAGSTYPGKRYIFLSQDIIEYAIILTAYELIIIFFFMFFVSLIKSNSKIKQPKNWSLGGNKIFYLIYIGFAILIFLVFGLDANILSFFSLSITEGGYSNVDSTFLILVRQITVVAIAIGFILVLNYCKNQYLRTGKIKYIFIAIIAAILNISVIVGNRRSVQMFTGILSIYMLIKTFKKSKRMIVFSILSATVSIFALMTLHRWGAADVGSYTGALASTDIDFAWLADYAQIYFGGPDAIATSIVFAQNIDLSFKNLLFDFLRTIFGISFLLKDNMLLTSEIYNMYIYRGEQLTGQLIFSTSYGYMFFGFIGAPIIIIINTVISLFLEKLLRYSYSFETVYLFGYCLLRMSLNLLVNTPTIISIITQMLGTLGLLILVAKLFSNKKRFN